MMKAKTIILAVLLLSTGAFSQEGSRFARPTSHTVLTEIDGRLFFAGVVYLTDHADTSLLVPHGFRNFEFIGRSVGTVRYATMWPVKTNLEKLPQEVSDISYEASDSKYLENATGFARRSIARLLQEEEMSDEDWSELQSGLGDMTVSEYLEAVTPREQHTRTTYRELHGYPAASNPRRRSYQAHEDATFRRSYQAPEDMHYCGYESPDNLWYTPGNWQVSSRTPFRSRSTWLDNLRTDYGGSSGSFLGSATGEHGVRTPWMTTQWHYGEGILGRDQQPRIRANNN